jgi:hypothetical protein
MAKSSAKGAQSRKGSKAKRASKSHKAQSPRAHEEDHIDGCDLEFLDSEATPDAALPEARGGVEILPARRRQVSRRRR